VPTVAPGHFQLASQDCYETMAATADHGRNFRGLEQSPGLRPAEPPSCLGSAPPAAAEVAAAAAAAAATAAVPVAVAAKVGSAAAAAAAAAVAMTDIVADSCCDA
jgi:hypothetical protein